MSVFMKELRASTGLTQRAFAEQYGIPVSTLRKWEQGESSPPDYVMRLIADTLPSLKDSLRLINGPDGEKFYYDRIKGTISDQSGSTIMVQDDLDEVKEQNLGLYLQELFAEYHRILDRFHRDCLYDKDEDIIWGR